MTNTTKGSIYAIVSAMSYGLNPLGGLMLGAEGINTHTILFSRFTIAVAILAFVIALRACKGNRNGLRERLTKGFVLSRCATAIVDRRDKPGKAWRVLSSHWALVVLLAGLFAVSALALFSSYLYMDSGIASTLLFVYPIIVALIMALFFHERITIVTVASLALAFIGIAMLNGGGDSGSINAIGCALVMLSSLAYAVYIVALNRWRVKIPVLTLNMYVMAVCACFIALHSFTDPQFRLMALPSATAVGYAVMLALVPTVISLVTMTRAIELVGSTPTAIMGAFEPLTAVVVGIVVFHEAFTPSIAVGNLLIILAVVLIISSKYVMAFLRMWIRGMNRLITH
ncbi:MAG: DMT family transporter [Muribaculaceae bacterium]